MLFFYTLLFFLFGSSAVAISNPFAGYWALKNPASNSQFAGKVLQVEEKGGYYFLKLDKNFKTISKDPVQPHEMSSLVDTLWHLIPTDIYGLGIRFMDLTFRMSGNKVSPDLIETRASRFNVLPDTSDCASRLNAIHDNRADGYWVIGDAPMDVVSVDSWRKILLIKGKKFTTFNLDNKFEIIKSSRKEVTQPSPGDYFPIPFIGMEPRWHRRIILKARQNSGRKPTIGVKYPSD